MGKTIRQARSETKELRKSVTGMLADRKRAGKPIPSPRPGNSLWRNRQNLKKKQRRLRKVAGKAGMV